MCRAGQSCSCSLLALSAPLLARESSTSSSGLFSQGHACNAGCTEKGPLYGATSLTTKNHNEAEPRP
eukprot:2230111-Karenia_brevis.AAC.1